MNDVPSLRKADKVAMQSRNFMSVLRVDVVPATRSTIISVPVLEFVTERL